MTILRGRVEVSGGALAPVVLTPGKQVRLSSSAGGELIDVEIDRVSLWRRGRLRLQSLELKTVLNEVSRSDQRLWVVEDDTATQTALNAVVATDAIDARLDALAQTAPIAVSRVGPLVWIPHK